MCLESGVTWSKAVFQDLSVTFIQFLLSVMLYMVFPVSDFLLSRCKQIYLVQMLPAAYSHKGLRLVNQVIFGYMVLIPGTGITGTFHKILPCYIVFSQAIDDNMHMNVAALVVSVHVCTD